MRMDYIAFRDLKLTTDELTVRMMFNKSKKHWRELI